MTKIRKLKRKKHFRVNVNRKRLRNKLRKLPTIECDAIKNAWESKHSVVKNLESMGLAYDPNQVLKMVNNKRVLPEEFNESESDNEILEDKLPKKTFVAEGLEKEAKLPRQKLFRLPNNEVQFITYMMDTYGEDYQAMARDRKNYNQMTWKQIRAKINLFKKIPEQYAEYLVKKGEIVLEDPTPLKKVKPTYDILEKPKSNNPKKKARKSQKERKSIIASIWEEQELEDSKLVTGDEDEVMAEENETPQLEKLQLFPDEEDKEEEIEFIGKNVNPKKMQHFPKNDSYKIKKKKRLRIK